MKSRLLTLSALLCSSPSFAFSTFAGSRAATRSLLVPTPIVLGLLRGGGENDDESPAQHVDFVSTTLEADTEVIAKVLEPIVAPSPKFAVGAMIAPMASTLASLGAAYGASLQKRPIATKSVTAGFIFCLSDYLAQRWEVTANGEEKKINKTRMVVSALVGLLYFGPAAHAWYGMIFKLLPGTSLVSTLQKAALGQAIFGPCFTCVFFATALLQSGSFSFGQWFTKIKNDLPGAWIAGLGFWPLVDLVSYSMIQPQWIPLFVNGCSLVWTIYLSLIANKQSSPKSA